MLERLAVRWAFNVAALFVAAWILSGVSYGNDWWTLLIAAIVFTLANAFVKPVLAALGEPQHVGSRREAAGLKLLNNAMLALWSAGAAELMVAAGHAGLEREAAFGLLQRQIPYLQARKPSYTEGRHTPAMFFLRDMVKDLDLALDLFHSAGASMPGLGLTRELYAAAVPEHGEAELSAVIERFP